MSRNRGMIPSTKATPVKPRYRKYRKPICRIRPSFLSDWMMTPRTVVGREPWSKRIEMIALAGSSYESGTYRIRRAER